MYKIFIALCILCAVLIILFFAMAMIVKLVLWLYKQDKPPRRYPSAAPKEPPKLHPSIRRISKPFFNIHNNYN